MRRGGELAIGVRVGGAQRFRLERHASELERRLQDIPLPHAGMFCSFGRPHLPHKSFPIYLTKLLAFTCGTPCQLQLASSLDSLIATAVWPVQIPMYLL
jgi:hypothetical protein